MSIKNIIASIMIFLPLQLWPCFLPSAIKKLIADRDIRLIDAWLTQIAPTSIRRDIGGKDTIIPLNWSGLIYHIALPEIDCPTPSATCPLCKLKGFHHDYLGKIEQSHSIQFNHISGNPKRSVYHAGIDYQHLSKESTFFPQDWTLRQVAQEIATAIRKAKVISHSSNGAILQGAASDGTQIIFLITSNWTVGSAYPLKNT